MKAIVILGFISVIFLTPAVSYALDPIVQCGFSVNGAPTIPCTACDFFALASNAIRWLVALITLVITLVVVWAGLLIATSGGDSHKVSDAKKMLTNALIGFAILLSAWLIVDTLMKITKFGTGSELGPWNTINVNACKTPAGTTIPGPTPGTPTPEPSCEEAGNCPSADWQSYFGFQSGISAQTKHVSADLNTLLSCMAGTLKAQGKTYGGEISSISDSKIASGQRTFEYCSKNKCTHTIGSCHYGGTCWAEEKSYAADFGTGGSDNAQKAADTIAAAKSCGATYAIDELNRATGKRDHVHVSIGRPKCSCN